MRYAVGKGVFIAVAGGNDYEDGNPIERLAEQAGPIEGAMVVSAVGSLAEPRVLLGRQVLRRDRRARR